MKKRLLSILLAALMVFSLLPVSAFATTPEQPVDETLYWGFDESTKAFYLSKTAAAITEKGVSTLKAFTSTEVFHWNDGEDGPVLPWKSVCESVQSVEILNDIAPGSTAYWFFRMSGPNQIKGIEHLYTGNVTSMTAMFAGCTALASLNVSNFDTSAVTKMDVMFSGCEALSTLYVSNFDTSNVTNMESMFKDCAALESLDLSNFNTSKVTSMNAMFYDCTNLRSLDLSKFDTSKVTSMNQMFYGCSELRSLDLSGFNTTGVQDMNAMFYDCSSLASLDLSGFNTTGVTTMANMFHGCSSLASLDLSGFDTTRVTTMESMFSGCSSLASLDLPKTGTPELKNVKYMFQNCKSLKTVDLSNFDLSNISSPLNARILNDCSAVLIKTPKNLSKTATLPTVELPVKWLNADTLTEYEGTSLPTEQTKSITLVAGVPVQSWSALQDAIVAAPGSEAEPATATMNVILKNDLTAPAEGGASITIPAGKDITLDLNGKVLNANGKCRVITVNEGGKLAVIDSLPETEHKGYIDANGLWQLGTPQNGETVKNLTGGVITGGVAPVETINTSTYSYGGGVYNEGTFAMYGGNIAGNTNEQAFTVRGGGVYNEGTFTMYNGSIVGNVISETSNNKYGGGVCNEGSFTMKNGNISSNKASKGGGVYINSKCTFTMENGKISGNTSEYGGGVYNIGTGNATFRMKGGEISGNTAVADCGGGIHTSQKAAKIYLTADAGKTISITGNTAGTAVGGVNSVGELHLSGKVIIKDNICENTYDSVNYPVNLAVKNSKPITIDGALTGSEIYVTEQDEDNKHCTGVLTSGFDAGIADVFTYDGPETYNMILNADGELEVVAPPVAEVNGEKYPTLAAAFAAAAAQGDATIQLLDDVTVEETLYINSGSVTLDLNGYTLTGCYVDDECVAIFSVASGATLKVVDSSEEKTGAVKASEDNEGSIVFFSHEDLNAHVSIEDGTFTTNDSDVFSDAEEPSSVSITGGTFDFDPTDYVDVDEGYTVTENDDGTYTVAKVVKHAVTWQVPQYVTVEATVDDDPIESGATFAPGTEIAFTVTPDNDHEYAEEPEGWKLEEDGSITMTVMVGDDDVPVVIPEPSEKPTTESASFDLCNGSAVLEEKPENPTWGSYKFAGWYTAPIGGTKVDSGYAIGTTYYAHWQVSETNANLVLTESINLTADGVKIGSSKTAAAKEELALYGLAFTAATDSAPATLTMTNAAIDTATGTMVKAVTSALRSDVALTIKLVGDNTIRLGDGERTRYGIYSTNALTLDGGTLTVAAGDSSDSDSYGVYVKSGNLTNGCERLTATSGASTNSSESYSCGVYVRDALINNEDMTIIAAGGTATSSKEDAYSFGVYLIGGTLTNNGTLTGTGGSANSDGGDANSCGIIVKALTNSGTLTGTGGTAEGSKGAYSCGVRSTDNTNSGALTGTGGTATSSGDAYSYGVYAQQGILTNSGTLTGTAGTSPNADNACGVHADYGVTVTDGSVTSYGKLEAMTKITADGAVVTGATETFTSGETKSLTQSGTDPIVISFKTAVTFDESSKPVNGGNAITYGTTYTVTAPTVSDKNGALNPQPEMTFTYYESDGNDGWTALDEQPTDAGSYKVVIAVKDDNATYMGSKEYTFSIAKADVDEAPALADSVTINYASEKITPKNGYEVSTTSGASFDTDKLTGETAIDFTKTYYIRKAADDNHNASAETEYKPTRPATPTSAPELDSKTDTTVTVTAVDGQEYSKDNGTTWVSGTEGKVTFTGLSANSAYSIITRVKAVTTEGSEKFASANSPALTGNTKTAPASAPSGITASVTATSVILPPSGKPNTYEYSANGTNWQDGNAFTGLDPATQYTYYVRVKETDTAMPSQAATVTAYTNQSAPKKGDGYTISSYDNDGKPIITITSGYEVSISPDFGTTISNGTALTVGETYYVRKAAAQDGAGASAGTAFVAIEKPKVTISATSSDSKGGSVKVEGADGGVCYIGTRITVTATPKTGYKFLGWDDGSGNPETRNPYTFEANDATVLEAKFAVDREKVETAPVSMADTYGSGSVKALETLKGNHHYTLTCEPDTIQNAGTYKLTAKLEDGYVWEDGSTTDKTFFYTVTKKVTSALPENVSANTSGNGITGVTNVMEWRKSTDSEYTQNAPANLKPGTYYIRMKGDVNHEAGKDVVVVLRSPVTTNAPTDITANTAKLNGTSTDGISTVTYQYRKVGSEKWLTSDDDDDILSGLTANTEYEYFAVVNDTAGEVMTFRTEKINQPTGSIQVHVKGADSTPVTVTVEQGNTIVATRTGSIDGNAMNTSFAKLADGYYNLVVSTGSYTETRLLEIKSGAAVNAKFDIPTGSLGSVVEVKKNTPKVAVDGLADLITEKEADAAAAGSKSVEVKLEVEKQENADGKDQITVLAGNQVVDTFLDMSLFKTTTEVNGDNKATTRENIGSEESNPVLEIVIPFNTNRNGLQIYHYHNGVAKKLAKLSERPTGNFTDGTYYIGDGYLFVYSSRFSTYAIGYEQQSGGSSTGGGGSDSSYAVELSTNVKNGKVEVSPRNASAGSTVTITVTPDKGFTLETLTVTDKNGKEVALTTVKIGETYTFKMPSGKVSISATFMEDNSMLNFFVDVKATDYYYDAVLWAAENGITKGTDDVHFSPEIGVTRAQVVTFLWRAAGCPEPVGNSDKFTDLLADQYYIKAVAWAIEQGITKGVTDTTFEPEMVCTRGQIVTFLARFAGVEDADTESVFTDVPANEFFAAAVKWAKDNGVTSGVTDTTFEPYTNCNRAQVVTFLYRWMVK